MECRLARGGPVGILDWDLARPGPALHDLAYAAWYLVPFRPDAECTEWLGYRSTPDRRARLAIIADAYGVSAEGLVERVVTIQEETRDLVASLASRGIEPQASWQAQGHLDELQARIEWTRANAYLVR